jgi:hypothetical protein
MQRDPSRNDQQPATLSFQRTTVGPRSHGTAHSLIAPHESVAVTYSGDPSVDEIADMVVDVLHREGVATRAVWDGDRAAFEADVLLLMGSGRWFPRLAAMAKKRPSQRPRTVLWQLQPLPPPVLTQRAGQLSEKLLAARWEDLLGTWASGLSRLLPARGRVRTVLQRLLAMPVRQEFERLGGAGYGNVGRDDLCMIFEEAAWLSENLIQGGSWIDTVACSTPTRVAFLRQCGLVAKFVPLGFHPAWGENRNEERDIDVLFVGTQHSASRRGLVPEVLRQLRDWGYRTCEVERFPLDRQRTELLQRARVVLNVLRFPWEFPGPRLFVSAACGALCVSNEAVQNEPFQPGLHFIRAPRARMAESISWYLTNEEERRRRAARALQSFNDDFPLLASVAKLLDPVQQGSQALRSRAA